MLGTAPIRNIVAKVVESELTRELTLTKRDAKSENQRVLEKIVAEMRARVAARTQKEISRRKNALETSSLPAKLADCRANDVERTELFIVEGDSALGTAKLARDSEFRRSCLSAARYLMSRRPPIPTSSTTKRYLRLSRSSVLDLVVRSIWMPPGTERSFS